jgi:DNA-binding NarL/FixJ family response regulator
LTSRQREILEHIARGRTNDEIAKRLVVSRRTVERHVEAILDRLGAENRTAAAAVAVAAGLARVTAEGV